MATNHLTAGEQGLIYIYIYTYEYMYVCVYVYVRGLYRVILGFTWGYIGLRKDI